MMKVTLAAALDAARKHNASITTAYREASRHLVSRAVSSLAAAAAEQRHDLGLELDALAAKLPASLGGVEVDFPGDLVAKAGAPVPDLADPAGALAFFRDIEDAERQLFVLLAHAAAVGPDVQAAFAAFAEQSRKRSAVAGDHLDLLGLSNGLRSGPGA